MERRQAGEAATAFLLGSHPWDVLIHQIRPPKYRAGSAGGGGGGDL